MNRLFLLALCYLVGAIPTSYLCVQYYLKKDIRTLGSGNSGATNASRVLGLWAFVFILCVDAAKAYAALYVLQSAGYTSTQFLLFAAAAVLLGNGYSPFLRFAGGKGVSTMFGLLLFFLPLGVVGGYVAVFMLVFYLFYRVDVASLSASLGGIAIVWAAGCSELYLNASIVGAVWIWVQHWKNIRTLLKG